MKSMTPRQWKLYRLIRDNTLNNNPPLTQKEICDAFPYDFIYNERPNDKCPMIWQDVDFINSRYEVEKIIVVDRFTYRLGTKTECEDYANKLLVGAVKKFRRYWAVNKKMEMDGQGKLVSAQDKIIDEKSQARAFTEAFVDYALNYTEEDEIEVEEPQEAETTQVQEPERDERVIQYDLWGNQVIK
ncbi:MAG: hypothetical protein M0R51_13800 [Clostridia bacterium]|jgi:hypothetical protein|nr:hypothetical protein [Clostridia bacterium]